VKTEVAPPPAADLPEPEEPDRRRGKRVTIIVLVLSGIIGGLWAIGPFVFAGHDDPTAIDSKPVRRAVAAACTQLRVDLAAVPNGIGVADRAEAENRAVEALVARVRAVGPDALRHDQPTEQWLGDWEQIVAARRQAVQAGKRYTTPQGGGAPVNIRMFELIRSGLEQCDVPRQLLVPEPGAGNG
jgi:hypothetical protein